MYGEGVEIQNEQIIVDFNRKWYVKEIHDNYKDLMEDENKDILANKMWSGDNYIKHSINKIELIKNHVT